jgi:hypothetical protein
MAHENLLDDFLSWMTWNMLQLKQLTTMYSGMLPTRGEEPRKLSGATPLWLRASELLNKFFSLSK